MLIDFADHCFCFCSNCQEYVAALCFISWLLELDDELWYCKELLLQVATL